MLSVIFTNPVLLAILLVAFSISFLIARYCIRVAANNPNNHRQTQ